MAGSADDHELERAHYMEVRHAFLEYSAYMERDMVQSMQKKLLGLPPNVAKMLSAETTKRKLDGMKEAIRRNQAFLDKVVEFQDRASPFPLSDADFSTERPSKTTARQVDKVNTTLHQMMRDWSVEGAQEREQSYGAVLRELERLLPVDDHKIGALKVLVPGAGLGRLAMEIVSRGYSTQGNEFSYFMLMVSNFVLNGISEAGSFVVSPFVDSRCNTFKIDDMLRKLNVPDVCPSELLDTGGASVDFSMSAGEWLEAYADQLAARDAYALDTSAGDACHVTGRVSHGLTEVEAFDSIVTVFFLDTAPVVVEYIEAISRLLKEGGVWINFGPLLYHWAQSSPGETDPRFERSVELTWEEIRHVCVNYGLQIVHEERREAMYNANQPSMMKTLYSGVLCSAVKQPKS